MALDPPPAGARAGLLGGTRPQKTHQRAPRRRCAGRPLGGWWPPWAAGGPGALCCTPAHRYFRTPAVSIAERCGANAVLLTRQLILLRHEFLRREGFAITELQHGHRGRLLTSAPINRRRMVAIEFGM
jgi:hypothetical protein